MFYHFYSFFSSFNFPASLANFIHDYGKMFADADGCWLMMVSLLFSLILLAKCICTQFWCKCVPRISMALVKICIQNLFSRTHLHKMPMGITFSFEYKRKWRFSSGADSTFGVHGAWTGKLQTSFKLYLISLRHAKNEREVICVLKCYCLQPVQVVVAHVKCQSLCRLTAA